MLTMWDAAVPPAHDPGLPVAAGYIGGADAAHVWTPAEWQRVQSFGAVKFLLPIYVASLRVPDGAGAGRNTAQWCRTHGVPTSVAVALDVEQNVAQAAHDSGYVAGWCGAVAGAGFVPLIYTSAASGHLFTNYERWLAEWNGTPHLIPGTAATQYAAPGFGTQLPYDLSVVRDGFALWPAHYHGGQPVPNPNAKIRAIVAHPGGYTQLGEDGGVFVYGDPHGQYFHGSAHGMLTAPDVASGIAYTGDYGGYWITTEAGAVFSFGNAPYLGHAYDGK